MRAASLFVGHGAPTLALDAEKGAPLRALGEQLASARALLVVSAHWERAPLSVGTVSTRPLMYDFYGFPPPLYRVAYPAPAAEELARRVGSLLGPLRAEPERALDHGVWTPLVHMFPKADKPVLQLSMPSAQGPEAVFALGQKLAPLRDEGVLLIGSGNITHNLRAIASDGSAPARVFAEFDAWAEERLAARDFDALIDARRRGPGYDHNHPTDDHYLPLLFALGAASEQDAMSYPVQGWEFGNLSRRAVLFQS